MFSTRSTSLQGLVSKLFSVFRLFPFSGHRFSILISPFSVVIYSFEILNLRRFECSDRVVFFCFLLSFGLSRSLSFFCSEHSMDLDWDSLNIGLIGYHWPIGVNTFTIQHSGFSILHSAFSIHHSLFIIHQIGI